MQQVSDKVMIAAGLKPTIGIGPLWSISRHQEIASAAEPLLSPAARSQIQEIAKSLGPGVNLSGMAAWADLIKRRKPQAGDDADTVAFLSDPRNKSQHTWHYVDIPANATGYDRVKYPDFTRDDDVVQMTLIAFRVLTDQSDRFSKLSALRLLIHYVADIHQPVHVGCGYIDAATDPHRLILSPAKAKKAGAGNDQGGNLIILPEDAGGRKLHEYWDGMGTVSVPETRTLNKAAAEAQIIQWASDSLAAARKAYKSLKIIASEPHKELVSWEGKAKYDARCVPVANRRMTEAASNLAALLNAIWR